jgi:hypothetical protein
LIWFAAQVATLYLAAFGTECGRLRTFRDFAAARRTFHKTTTGTLGLARFTAKLTTFYLAAVSTKLDTIATSLPFFVRLPAAIAAQKYSNKSRYGQNH